MLFSIPCKDKMELLLQPCILYYNLILNDTTVPFLHCFQKRAVTVRCLLPLMNLQNSFPVSGMRQCWVLSLFPFIYKWYVAPCQDTWKLVFTSCFAGMCSGCELSISFGESMKLLSYIWNSTVLWTVYCHSCSSKLCAAITAQSHIVDILLPCLHSLVECAGTVVCLFPLVTLEYCCPVNIIILWFTSHSNCNLLFFFTINKTLTLHGSGVGGAGDWGPVHRCWVNYVAHTSILCCVLSTIHWANTNWSFSSLYHTPISIYIYYRTNLFLVVYMTVLWLWFVLFLRWACKTCFLQVKYIRYHTCTIIQAADQFRWASNIIPYVGILVPFLHDLLE